ncbi:phage regulatory CII family protein [Nitrosospira briensis]|uniref:phage regulatory CII family protein n=1 Tax=Nitrosospira briensis TaxID=35799 RepID=UPI000468BCDD|nr:phage regulatory CII family protein [Nitrosospira briensis]
MTHRYSDINQHDALYKAARKYPGGIESLYKRLDLPSAARLYNKLRPGVESDYTGFEEVSLIIENLQEAGKDEAAGLPIQAFCWRHGYAAVKLPPAEHVSNGELLQMICKVMAEEGEVAAAISTALSDNWISPPEQEKIELAIRRAVQGLLELEKRVHERRRAPRA